MTPQEQIATFYEALSAGKGNTFFTTHASETFRWRACQPFGDGQGVASWFADYVDPTLLALSEQRREIHMLFGGVSSQGPDKIDNTGAWVTATGYLHGRFSRKWLGFEPTGLQIRLRWSDFFKIENGKITAFLGMVDIVDFLQQIGCDPLPPANGVNFVFPAPCGVEGIRLKPSLASESEKTMRLTHELLFEGLNGFNEKDLDSMGMERFFHKNLRWYGPGGIGACLSLDEFQLHHQGPWLHAFPDRKAVRHDGLICDGPFCGSAWWRGVAATQMGDYLGIEATNRQLLIGGIDYWLRDGDKFTENWVFIDFVDLFNQLGFDLVSAAQDKQNR